MKKISGFFKAIGRYFKNFGVAFAKGDIWVKLSAVIMGAGYFARKQIVNGLIMLIVEAAFVLMCVGYAAPNLAKFGTLGTVKFEQVFDPLTMQTTTNNYDNSFQILLNSVVALFIILIFVLFYIHNIKTVYKLQQMKEIYSGLPHIDCGSCGRPSCQAMAEEIVRGHGSVTDCIFKLREGIASLANKIVVLSESQPQTLKRRSGTK